MSAAFLWPSPDSHIEICSSLDHAPVLSAYSTPPRSSAITACRTVSPVRHRTGPDAPLLRVMPQPLDVGRDARLHRVLRLVARVGLDTCESFRGVSRGIGRPPWPEGRTSGAGHSLPHRREDLLMGGGAARADVVDAMVEPLGSVH